MPDQRSQRDSGAVLVLVAVSLVTLLTLVALVVDLGFIRDERRSHQSAVDFAALSAGKALGADAGPDGQAGCTAAVQYLRANVDDLPGTAAVSCAALPANCSGASSPVTVSDGGTAGKYQIEITYPVSDVSIADARTGTRGYDGDPCERIMVRLTSSVDAFFASVLGEDTLEIDTQAVVRQVEADKRRMPSFWLLEPFECGALEVGGGSVVQSGSATRAGVILLDSDGSQCTGQSKTLEVQGLGGGAATTIVAKSAGSEAGAINLVALGPGETCFTSATACNDGDIAPDEQTAVNSGGIYPAPDPRPKRATRAPVDHKYNCKSSYSAYLTIPIEGCTSGSQPHIDNLIFAVGSSGTPTGWNTWTGAGYKCAEKNASLVLSGNWHIDCPGSNGANTFTVSNGSSIAFEGGNVVFDGQIKQTGGTLEFNSANPTASLNPTCQLTVVSCVSESSAKAAWVYQRSGDLSLTGGDITATNTMFYQATGYFEITGGTPPNWTAPTEGPFKGLAIWSEANSSRYKIAGGASMILKGTFFTPYADPMTISGGSPVTPIEAQFISRKLVVNGGANLDLTPDPTTGLFLPPDPPLLIR